MAGLSGGVASAFGFRYQYLITVEILLDLFANETAEDWAVDVDKANQDSADIIVYTSLRSGPARAIQVKASMPESSTTIGVPRVRDIFAAIAEEHPSIPIHELITNRTMSDELTARRFDEEFNQASKSADFRIESLIDLTENLLSKVGRIRTAGPGGTGRDFSFLILRQIIDLVQEKGARTNDQRVTAEDIEPILLGKSQFLANVLGSRDWGKSINVPLGSYIDRPRVLEFLRKTLPRREVFKGAPKVALLHGISGSGKSSVASTYARAQLEHVAFVLWLDSSSSGSIKHQLPLALGDLGISSFGDEITSEDVRRLLRDLPVPWLLVLDGVRSIQEIDEWVPRSGYGQVIITTNRADFAKDYAPHLEMDRFDSAEARDFFVQRFPDSGWSDEAFVKCENIAKQLSYWPLALEIAVAWIMRRGGNQDSLDKFQDRIRRVDLNDSVLVPNGYPKTATKVIRDLLADLSGQAQRVLSCLLLLGGRSVPKRFLVDWSEALNLSMTVLFEELFAASFLQLEIMNVNPPHDYDELVSLHDFIILVLSDSVIELDSESVENLVETSERSLQTLVESGHFREGATIVRPIDSLMQCMLTNMQDVPDVLVRISVVMHNLAQMAVLTSNSSVARRWYTVALNVRQGHLGDPELVPGRVKLQLQTLAGLSSVCARELDVEGLSVIADNASYLVESVGKDYISDSTTVMAVSGICTNVLRYVPEAGSLIKPLTQFAGFNEVYAIDSAGNEKIARQQNSMEFALQMIERGQWRDGLERSLISINRSIEDGLLVDWMLDHLLEAGRLLALEIVRRPYEWPSELFRLLERLVVWLDENPVAISELQSQQISMLTGMSVGHPLAIDKAVFDLPPEDQRSSTVREWAYIASAIASQYERLRAHDVFRQLPDGVTVEVALDGGDDINFWQLVDSADGRPMLWVCTAGRVRYDERGRSDPVKAAFVAAGLPAPVQAGPLEVAEGWLADLQAKSLTVVDSNKVERVIADGLDQEFCDGAYMHGGFVLVYGDYSLASRDGALPPQGWVYLGTESSEPGSEGRWRSDTATESMRERGWLSRVRGWLGMSR